MRILAVLGSYRKNGATRAAFDAAVAGAREAGAEVEVLDLLDADFGHCRNCMACWQADTYEEAVGNCPCQDDLTPWIGKLPEVDGLLLASPVLVDSVTGLMKQFIERTAPLAVFKPMPLLLKLMVRPSRCPLTRLEKRPRVLLWITASSAPAWIARRMFPMVKKQFRAMRAGWPARVTGSVWVGGTLAPGWSLPEKTRRRARAAGARLAAR